MPRHAAGCERRVRYRAARDGGVQNGTTPGRSGISPGFDVVRLVRAAGCSSRVVRVEAVSGWAPGRARGWSGAGRAGRCRSNLVGLRPGRYAGPSASTPVRRPARRRAVRGPAVAAGPAWWSSPGTLRSVGDRTGRADDTGVAPGVGVGRLAGSPERAVAAGAGAAEAVVQAAAAAPEGEAGVVDGEGAAAVQGTVAQDGGPRGVAAAGCDGALVGDGP